MAEQFKKIPTFKKNIANFSKREKLYIISGFFKKYHGTCPVTNKTSTMCVLEWIHRDNVIE
jgi:hypothetical protein